MTIDPQRLPLCEQHELEARLERATDVIIARENGHDADLLRARKQRGPAQVGRSGSGETDQPGSRPGETGSGGANQSGGAAFDFDEGEAEITTTNQRTKR